MSKMCAACAQVQFDDTPIRWWQRMMWVIAMTILIICGTVGALTIGFGAILLWVTS